jgi:hypothetical protein
MHFEGSESFTQYRMQAHDKIRDEPYAAVSKQQPRITNLN